MHCLLRLFALTLIVTLSCRLHGSLVINELMFNPASGADADEWIEIHNSGPLAADLGGAKFSKGVTLTIPSGTTLAVGGYLVVAADVAAFTTNHPGFAGQVVGGWTGRLSNAGEAVQLDDAAGAKLCDVTFAEEGDWALRARGPVSFGHRGWIWENAADGGGHTLELRNPQLGAGHGQNWGVSAVGGGSPGEANSLASADVAPLIKDVKHRPEIPRSSDPIVVSCDLEDELPGATAVLHWRLDAGAWQQFPMSDGDGDGDVEATIQPQNNLAVIEWYIAATDGTKVRTWPAPARTSDIGVLPGTFGQVTNALVQVDNSFNPAINFTLPATQPIYRLIMTNAERAELAQIGSVSGQEDSMATMNGTFISHDGTGIRTVYNAGFRNRGQGSALGPPNNFHVGFRTDDRWNDKSSMAINCRYGYSQALGNALVQRAGLATQEAAVVRVRVNGADLSEPGVPTSVVGRMYGRYVRSEGRGGEWAERHYPDDSEGNFYRLDDHDLGLDPQPPGDLGSGEFRWEGMVPNAYSDTFIKETNKEANDYSDLINLCKIVSASPTAAFLSADGSVQPAISNAAYPAQVAAVLDLDNFYRYIAVDALLGNQEGGLSSGRSDDCSMYRGLNDTRFRFIPHDLDSCFDIGDTLGGVTRNIFTYDGNASPGTGVLGLTRLFNHPQLVPRYYAALLALANDWTKKDLAGNRIIDPRVSQLIDQIMSGWVPLTDAVTQNRSINDIKAYIVTRCTNVLAAIQENNSLTTAVGGADTPEGYKRTLDGSAVFSGTFNVAKTYSITVNGQLATTNYRTRTTPAATAGTWNLAVAAGGGTVLHPGLNRVVVKFWDAPGGTGNALNTLTADVLFQPITPTYTNVSGTLTAGSLRLTAPATYIPGKPVLVRADVLDSTGNVDRSVWDGTVNLSANVGGVSLPSIQLYNGTGSALATIGGGGGGGITQIIFPGGTAAAPNASAPDWRMLFNAVADPVATWKSDLAFADATWTLGKLQAGAGDGDERTNFTAANVDTAQTTRRAFYFRRIFSVTDPAAFAQLLIKAVVDDGAVFYLNGTQVYADNMPAGTPTLTTPASTNRVGTAETQIRTFDISAYRSLLIAGDNLLAVEVHNYYLASPVVNSADLSFDCALEGVAPAADPGNLTLTGNFSAPGATFTAQKAMTSLTGTPAITTASGTLATGTTNWSGVIQVTADVTVPSGGTLNIAAGTHVLVDGDATAGSTAGKRIIVNGALNSNGTFAAPVAITATNATDRWGGFLFSAAQPSVMDYTLINHAGHTTGVGHTGRGPMIRLAGTTLPDDPPMRIMLNDSVLADGPAKAIYSANKCDLVISRSLIERMITGPELGDGAALLIEDSNIQRILPDYRESTSATPDDEDCMYIHNGSGRSVIMRRSVFARCGDDVFDGLGGPLVVEDSILREGWDKGMSLLNNDLTITRTQIINCDKAIVPKSSTDDRPILQGGTGDPRTVTATNVTIVSENHDTTLAPWGYGVPPSSPDADTPSTGFYTQDKAGQSHPNGILEINAKNCIVKAQAPVLVDPLYDPARTVVTYSDLTLLDNSSFGWPGTGNISADPLFASTASGNYRITSSSPCRDAGDPAIFDADNSRIDMGALPFGAGGSAGGIITWTPAGGPYRITADATVPLGSTLVINSGTSVFFDQNRKLTVNGTIKVLGTDDGRVVFAGVPGVLATDPITGLANQPAKWAGLVVVGPATGAAITGSEFHYCTFLNAQPAVAAGNTGSLGIIRAFALVDHCIFLGTRLRQLYGENCALQVQYCTFVDPFDPSNPADNPAPPPLGYGLDNIAEPLKVANANIANPNYVFGIPNGGYFRVWYNEFRGNKGHNDVFDADSGAFNAAAGVNSTNPILDCRYNNFIGLTGDEHIDLGGDAYVAGNIFQRGHKDTWTNDHGYSNCISSGDKGGATTIWVARNIAFNVDHMINCKAATATIFEHNTIANFQPDFSYTSTPPVAPFTQNVKNSAINQYVPDDDSPSRGDGAYIANNIFHNIPRVVTWADLPATTATKLEATNNYLNGLADNSVGPVEAPFSGGTLHPDGFTALGAYVQPGDPQFVNEGVGDYALKMGSPARGTAPGGIDYGATVAEWIHILGGPSGTTNQTTASFTITGPAMVAYKWRLDGGAWSAVQPIGNGLIFPRGATPTVRHATLTLDSLAPGAHTLEVVGRDPAGNWQDTDRARTVAGLPPFAPTSRTWTVDPTAMLVRINEVLADSATVADAIELHNPGSAPVNVSGWTLTDDPLVPAKYTIPGGTTIPSGGFVTLSGALTLDRDGDLVQLRNGAALMDSINFGHQIADMTIGRIGSGWTLCTPTLGSANFGARLGDPRVVRINEWLAANDVLYGDDWIELVNPATLPIDLAGLRITDNRAGDPTAHIFPPLTFIAPGGFARFTADGAHLGFSLDAQQEEIALLDSTGALLDSVLFFPQRTDWSMGRDSTGALTSYELPTRGIANETTTPAYLNALAILRGLRITEIMYNPLGGNDYEFVELRNVGGSAFDLAGAKFVNGITFTFGAFSMIPGDTVVLVRNLTKFRSRYGNSPIVAGVFTGALDNSGEGLAIQLPPPYDANALDFNFSDTWYTSTDGSGRSLVVPNALLAAGVWGDRDTWLASVNNGGEPAGFVIPPLGLYADWSGTFSIPTPMSDGDNDGVGAIVEFGFGQDPTKGLGINGPAGLPYISQSNDGKLVLHLDLPESALATEGHGMPELTYTVRASNDLVTWSTIATKTFATAWSGTAAISVGTSSNGRVPVTITDPLIFPPRRHVRVSVTWTP